MNECNYCDSSFEEESKYFQHLSEEHQGELSKIDERRVEEHVEGNKVADKDSIRLGLSVLLVIGLVAVAGFAVYTVILSDGQSTGFDTDTSPSGLNQEHYHGAMFVQIEGEEIDFSQPRFQLQDDYFHFESGEGERWHVHGRQVTLEYAMKTLSMPVTENSVTYQGTTYRDSDSEYNVRVRVSGRTVDPSSYVLQEGDVIRITVEEAN